MTTFINYQQSQDVARIETKLNQLLHDMQAITHQFQHLSHAQQSLETKKQHFYEACKRLNTQMKEQVQPITHRKRKRRKYSNTKRHHAKKQSPLTSTIDKGKQIMNKIRRNHHIESPRQSPYNDVPSPVVPQGEPINDFEMDIPSPDSTSPDHESHTFDDHTDDDHMDDDEEFASDYVEVEKPPVHHIKPLARFSKKPKHPTYKDQLIDDDSSEAEETKKIYRDPLQMDTTIPEETVNDTTEEELLKKSPEASRNIDNLLESPTPVSDYTDSVQFSPFPKTNEQQLPEQKDDTMQDDTQSAISVELSNSIHSSSPKSLSTDSPSSSSSPKPSIQHVPASSSIKKSVNVLHDYSAYQWDDSDEEPSNEKETNTMQDDDPPPPPPMDQKQASNESTDSLDNMLNQVVMESKMNSKGKPSNDDNPNTHDLPLFQRSLSVMDHTDMKEPKVSPTVKRKSLQNEAFFTPPKMRSIVQPNPQAQDHDTKKRLYTKENEDAPDNEDNHIATPQVMNDVHYGIERRKRITSQRIKKRRGGANTSSLMDLISMS